MMKTLISLFFLLLLVSCNKEQNLTLQKCWTLAEDRDTTQVFYRCGDERLGFSRFRPTYKLLPNNKCEYLVLHPADAHFLEDGVYEYDPEISELKIWGFEGELIANFKVISISEKEMKVKDIKFTSTFN